MKIARFSLGVLQANCYLVIHQDHCLVVDPADEASFILEEVQRRNLTITALVATHGHFDHIMAAGEIQLSYKVPLFMCRKDLFLVDRLPETAKYFLGYEPHIIKPSILEEVHEGVLQIGNFALNVISTPGHTPGSSCFFLKKEHILFTGDTLFKEGIGRYDFSYSNKKELDRSLIRILALPGHTVIYPGHGDTTMIEAEKISRT